MNRTKQTRTLMENISQLLREENYRMFASEYDGQVKGFISTWNKGQNGEPVVYYVSKNQMIPNSWIIIGGILVNDEIVNTTEAGDDWYSNEKDALEVAKGIATEEHFGGKTVNESKQNKIYMENTTAGHNKFYEVTDLGNGKLKVVYGKIGSEGKEHIYDNEFTFDELVSKKKKKGYVEV